MSSQNNNFSVIYSIPGFAVINKPFDVAMDGPTTTTTTTENNNNNTTTTVQSWAENETELLKIAKNPPDEEEPVDHEDENQKRRRNTKDTIDGKVRFVHQLDYSTSGLLCLAFSKRQAAKVTYCFETRSSKKEYLAVLDGWVEEGEYSNSIDPSLITPAEILQNLTAASSSLCPEMTKLIAEKFLKKNINYDQTTTSYPRFLVSIPIGHDNEDPKGFKMRTLSTSSSSSSRIRQRINDDDDEKQNEEQEDSQKSAIPIIRNPKPATTLVTVLAHGYLKKNKEKEEEKDSAKRRKVTLVHFQLLTGRRHQLRVHSLAIGHPIVGDRVYNNNCNEDDENNCRCERMLLHAWRLSLPKDQISLAADGKQENELFKQRRREIKQVRKQAAAGVQQRSQNDNNDDNDEEEQVEKILFMAPEPLTQYFSVA